MSDLSEMLLALCCLCFHFIGFFVNSHNMDSMTVDYGTTIIQHIKILNIRLKATYILFYEQCCLSEAVFDRFKSLLQSSRNINFKQFTVIEKFYHSNLHPHVVRDCCTIFSPFVTVPFSSKLDVCKHQVCNKEHSMSCYFSGTNTSIQTHACFLRNQFL